MQDNARRQTTHQSNHLDAPLLKLPAQLRERAQLRRAHRREVRRVREQDRPLAVQPLVEVDVARRRLGLEVGRFGPDAQAGLLAARGRGEEAAEGGRLGGAEGGQGWVGGGGGAQGAGEEGCHFCCCGLDLMGGFGLGRVGRGVVIFGD